MDTKSQDRYSLETLLPLNPLFDHDHGLRQEDVDTANELVRHIESTRNSLLPKIGDQVRYTTRYGDYYANALIEKVSEDGAQVSICLCPYIPFTWMNAEGIRCSVSGGPFTNVPISDLQADGTSSFDFCFFGHCGACGYGAVYFEAEVRLWEYKEPDPLYGDFSTKDWRKYYLYKFPEVTDGDLYRGDCISFGSEREFQRFLRNYDGTVFPAPSPNGIIVWCYRDSLQAVSFEEWNEIDASVSLRKFSNEFRMMKIVKDHSLHESTFYFVESESDNPQPIEYHYDYFD